ncbi:MAG: trypsin-like peptidase domain-containing protein [Verrucomicrobiales bacterium]|nr:trypsin-like peptidase domain-containing protein [Verrucomicrobiales bacterium]
MLGFLALLVAASAGAAAPERSVIQIFNFSQQPVWDAPWRWQPVRREGGSGFVIRTPAGLRVMSNAHVVSWSRQLLVRRFQDPRPYQAEVEFIGHDCDLVLIRVADEAFFQGIEPLGFGDLPEVRSTVVTYGYPAGGEQISYTRGVVSRIELQNYVHIGNRAMLAVQTDAAINPGNSGGPVIQEDKVVGVAFQGVPGLENAGFFIPPEVIRHFLRDVEDGTYHGFPLAGLRVVSLQNPAYRKFLGLPETGETGARIDGIIDVPASREVLRPDDVLLEVAGFPVASDATIVYRENRVAVALAFQQAQHGEKVPIRLLREGKETKVELPLSVYAGDRTIGNQYDQPPRYFVHGGLVFAPLSQDYLRTLGRELGDTSTSELVYELFYTRHEKPDKLRSEPVVLAGALAHEVNANLNVRSRALVDRINGVRIEKLEDVVRALDENRGGQHVIEFVGKGGFECLDREAAAAANDEILKTYGVTNDRRL